MSDTTGHRAGKAELTSRPAQTAPTLNTAAQEAAAAVAPLGIASLIPLENGQTTPCKDLSVLDLGQRTHKFAPRRPEKGSSLLGDDEQFKRSASDDTPAAFLNNDSTGLPPAKKPKTAEEPMVQMTAALKQVMDSADEVAAAKESILSGTAISSQVAAEQ